MLQNTASAVEGWDGGKEVKGVYSPEGAEEGLPSTSNKLYII